MSLGNMNQPELKILDASRVVDTVEKLNVRISERFPGSSLRQVSQDLLGVAKRSSYQSHRIQKPIISIRIFVALLILSFTLGLGWILISVPLSLSTSKLELIDIIQVLEAGTNELILVAAGILFLTSLEKRIKRKRAIEAIHELRSIAHIIDMHQLTKDPERFLKSWVFTEHSPKQDLSPFELERYLDYCTELLSLISKISVLYAQSLADEVLLAAVSEIETVTTNLSVKIWQKIMIIRSLKDQPEALKLSA